MYSEVLVIDLYINYENYLCILDNGYHVDKGYIIFQIIIFCFFVNNTAQSLERDLNITLKTAIIMF